ncbi:MAG: hypothetical protein IK102_03970 [Treponema sp.]|nr:hypothetical protein [Treponema sp.]
MKKYCLCFLFLVGIISLTWCTEECYHPDYGLAEIDYDGTSPAVNLENFCNKMKNNIEKKRIKTQTCKKLSNREKYLIQGCLNKYDYIKDEVYDIRIFSEFDSSALWLFIEITNSGLIAEYKWCGFYFYY